jgi:pimeloyl-ACP methyl ester carboxylesterase
MDRDQVVARKAIRVRIQANGVPIEVEDIGSPGEPAVLLVMGLGMQMVAWPQALVESLRAAGYRVVRFDNRDVGLSRHFTELGVPNVMWESVKHRIGLPVRAPYRLHDMAGDALGVLDALGIRQAHVVGVSMGGMIAQRVALAARERVLSLTSIMSSSGARYLPGPKAQTMQALFSRPADTSEQAIVDHLVKVFRVIGSPGFPLDEPALRERILLSVRRSYDPTGTMRQMAAIAADTTRADELLRLSVPALVVHGVDDPLVPVACGQDTARRIRGAQLAAVRGMGHDLPPGVVERILEVLLPHLHKASAA